MGTRSSAAAEKEPIILHYLE